MGRPGFGWFVCGREGWGLAGMEALGRTLCFVADMEQHGKEDDPEPQLLHSARQ